MYYSGIYSAIIYYISKLHTIIILLCTVHNNRPIGMRFHIVLPLSWNANMQLASIVSEQENLDVVK